MGGKINVQEVADMLAYHHLTEHAEVMKEWYEVHSQIRNRIL